MNSNIFFFLSSDAGLSVTTTNEGLLEDALINPHEPSSKENLIPLTVNILFIVSPSILILSFFNFLILEVKFQLKYIYPHLYKKEPLLDFEKFLANFHLIH